MKYFLTLIGVAAFVAIILTVGNISEYISEHNGITIIGSFQETTKGNGEVSTETRVVSNFEKVESSNAVKVILSKDTKCGVTISTDSNLQKLLKTEVKNKKLHIYIEGGIKDYKEITAHVNYVKLKELRASSASNIICTNAITEDTLTLKASSAASINLSEVTINTLQTNASSTAQILLTGNCTYLEAKASSAANIDLKDLKTLHCKAKASSAASITLDIVESLEAKASSGSQIRYKGEPQNIKTTNSSGGSIKSVN